MSVNLTMVEYFGMLSVVFDAFGLEAAECFLNSDFELLLLFDDDDDDITFPVG